MTNSNKNNYSFYISFLAPLIITIVVYGFGVVKAGENRDIRIGFLEKKVDKIELVCKELDEEKADLYIIELIFKRLDSIDSKLDNVQEHLNK